MSETVRSRFLKVLNGELPEDRLPMIEWASWWDKTINRWLGEGLPNNVDLFDYFGLDRHSQFWLRIGDDELKAKYKGNEGEYYIKDEKDYEEIFPHLYPEEIPVDPAWLTTKELQDKGDTVVWISLNGFFWWTRMLFGIEPHLYAFYDYPELMHRIIDEVANYHIRCIDNMCKYLVPDFMTFAEDMSYNHGPMLSKDLYDEFLAPSYKKVIKKLKEYDIIPLIDSDGDVTKMIPWLLEVGMEGILPLERQAGVDIYQIGQEYPEWKMIGGYNKLVMGNGEEAIREEFERLLPSMKRGKFIPSVDHQTPPNVSLDDYKLFMRIFREYAEKACE